jgi:hypothetical protein
MQTAAAAETIGRHLRTNLSAAELYEIAVRDDEGLIAADGPLVVSTGTHTGRSPQDKFVVRERSSAGKVWWGSVNQPISEEHYDRLRARLMKYIADRPIYSQDLYIGADPEHRRALRVYSETAWASIFCDNRASFNNMMSRFPLHRINWTTSSFLIGTLALTLTAVPLYIWHFGLDWFQVALFFLMFMACGFSISLGYHRLFSHIAFQASWPIRLLTLIFGAGAFENSVLMWASSFPSGE